MIDKMACFLLAGIVILLASCSMSTPAADTDQKYQTYKDIPGVTQEEIEAVEKLLVDNPTLVYGFHVSTEAFYEEDGSLSGFITLLYGRMSELFGFEFEPMVCEWDELLEKIESKEIDFTAELSPMPDRQKTYYMTDPILQRSIKIFTDRTSEDLDTISRKQLPRIAFIVGSNVYPTVAATWKGAFSPTFLDSESDVLDSFIDGKIDAYIDESVMEALFDSYDFIESEEYYPLNYSPVSLTTGNAELEPIISIMQKYLVNGGRFEIAELYGIGNERYLNHKLALILTEEERAYIQKHNSEETAIPIACEIYNYPSSFYNSTENEFQGAAVDVLNEISDMSGLKFVIESTPNTLWPEILEGLENGEYALVSELFVTENRKNRFLWTEDPYYIDNYALLSRADYPNVDINQVLFHKVGLLEDTAYTEVFYSWFPNSVNTVMFDSTEEAFDALEKGEVDLLMMTQNFLLHITNYLEKPYFKTNIVFNYTTGSYFGFNKDEEILCSIINKAQRLVNTVEISDGWQRKVFDYESKMLRDTIPVYAAFISLLAAGLFVILFLFVKNRRITKNLEAIVEERTKELALQTSTLMTIFESIPDLVFCKDIDLRYTRCNKSFENHFGSLEKDLIGRTDHGDNMEVSDDMANSYHDIDRQVIREGRAITVEEVIPSVDGRMPIFETVKIPLMQDGEVIGIMGIARDITERKAAEETIKLTLDNLDTCIYVTETETGEILFINERMMKEFGEKEYYGEPCWKVLQDGFTERCDFCPVPKLLESGDEYIIWEEHNTVTGKYYRNTDSLIRWHDGKTVHMQHSVDVTDAKKLQQDLENASRAKGDFLSRMSHEIRTPLNAIIGMNSIGMNTDDLEKIHHCHERIDNASRHLLGVINDILDMSKIEAEKFELSHSEFDFEKMLANITNVVNFRADEKSQNLVVKLDDDIPAYVYGDELRLSQVITNLLTNAVKFTPEHGTIVLGAEKIDQVNDEITLKIRVEDNGIGITDEQKERLFTSFEQADGSISRRFGGTGLGLAISKRIVEMMGGEIWIESEIDKGSKFIFTLKVQKSKMRGSSKLSNAINKDNLRILAVDDCIDIREYFAYVMAAHNLSCDVAESGMEALEKISECGDRPYNIFFVDWQMPEMDGIELTRKIKGIIGDNAVVIMISVADWSNIEEEATAAGIERFIPKPLYPSALINTINECIGVASKKTEEQMQNKLSKMNKNFEGHTILIAEDVEVNREIITAILEDTEVTIDFAENGEVVVSMFESDPEKYSLIFMDIQMPVMDGFEATRVIRELDSEWAKNIPIIAMTANVFREDIENCLEAGMNAHIGKPFDIDGLLEMLSKYLS